MSAYLDAMRNYATFSGRTSRAGFWLFALVVLGLALIGLALDGVLGTGNESGGGIFVGLVYLVHLIPQLSVSVRRLHDIDRTGWWLLISFTGIGALVILVFDCLRGTVGPNRFGEDPLQGRSASRLTQAPQRDVVAELERLAELKARGSLSDAEYDSLKARALAGH